MKKVWMGINAAWGSRGRGRSRRLLPVERERGGCSSVRRLCAPGEGVGVDFLRNLVGEGHQHVTSQFFIKF
jgi:hypothetical protein